MMSNKAREKIIQDNRLDMELYEHVRWLCRSVHVCVWQCVCLRSHNLHAME